MNKNDLPYAVVLGLVDTGYGVVRSLSPYGMKIAAFENDMSRPEVNTKLCEVIKYDNESRLLEQLVSFSRGLELKPVLFITSDALVNFFSANSDTLRKHYLIDFPGRDVTSILMEKGHFARYAEKNDFLIPKTNIIYDENTLAICLKEAKFPCIVKPYWRNANWKKASFPKVFFFENYKKFISKIKLIFSVEKNLIVQEWIPGGDSDIYFTLVYYNENSKCIAEFTGRKLRQWPVLTGSTSCAEPISQNEVRNTTIRLFNTIKFSGFGSVEYKKSSENNKFYIMEPTVGRANHQSYISTANGVNIPAIAYSHLTGFQLGQGNCHSKKSIWIDDPYDLLSIIVSFSKGILNFNHLVRSLLRRRSFRFFNRNDMRPFLSAIYMLTKKSILLVCTRTKKIMNQSGKSI